MHLDGSASPILHKDRNSVRVSVWRQQSLVSVAPLVLIFQHVLSDWHIYKLKNARHEHETYIASLFISQGKNKESSDDEVLAIETVSSFASDDDDVENESSSDSYSSESESDWTPNVEEFRGFPRMGEGEYDLALNFIVKIV